MAYANNQSNAAIVIVPHHVCHPLYLLPRPAALVNPSFGLAVLPCVELVVPLYRPPRAPQDLSLLIQMDEERSRSLLQFMVDEGLMPSPEEELKRKAAIAKLKQIVVAWIKRVAHQRRLPKQHVAAASATILTYGSYGLGVHGPESDIDALCMGPCFASMAEDFFIVLRNMLQSRSEVTEVYCVKDAKVPLMRFKFDGISFDLPYAQLSVVSVSEDVDVLNPFVLRHVDETSWKSLSGVRANKRILQLVPNVESFRSILRCVKLWAKRRGVYGNLFGYFGGVHLAILAAFVCQLHPNASINALISMFFKTFAFWQWPNPVRLQDGTFFSAGSNNETRSFMPIQLPCSPYEYCHSNITRSTFYKIRTEFLRGHSLTQDIVTPEFKWSNLFEHFLYSKNYTLFAKIYLSADNQEELGDWVGWVKSRFRCLILKLEEVQGTCDPDPTEYIDVDAAEPNIVFYWGLRRGKTNLADVQSIEADFSKNIYNGFQGPCGGFTLSLVQASQLPNNFDSGCRNSKGTKACWKIIDYNQKRVPVYSRHWPQYMVGYVATDGNPEYPCAGG